MAEKTICIWVVSILTLEIGVEKTVFILMLESMLGFIIGNVLNIKSLNFMHSVLYLPPRAYASNCCVWVESL